MGRHEFEAVFMFPPKALNDSQMEMVNDLLSSIQGVVGCNNNYGVYTATYDAHVVSADDIRRQLSENVNGQATLLGTSPKMKSMNGSARPPVLPAGSLQRIRKRVWGLKCSLCVQEITKLVLDNPGVESCHVSLVRECAEITFWDKATDEETLKKALRGYDANRSDYYGGLSVVSSHPEDGYTEPDDPDTRVFEIFVPDMKCASCVAPITRALQNMSNEVRVDVTRRLVYARARRHIRPEELLSALSVIGYSRCTIQSGQTAGTSQLHVIPCEYNSDVKAASISGVKKTLLSKNRKILRIEYEHHEVSGRDLLQHCVYTGVCVDHVGETNITDPFEERPGVSISRLFLRVLVCIACLVLSLLMFGDMSTASDTTLFQVLIAATAAFICGSKFHGTALKQLRYTPTAPGMELLVSMSISLSFFNSLVLWISSMIWDIDPNTPLYFTPAIALTTAVLLGQAVEELVRSKASTATEMAAPVWDTKVTVMRGNSMPKQSLLSAELVHIGDMAQVYPNDEVVFDGVKVDPEPCYMDESNLTGEAKPVLKTSGSRILAGTILIEGNAVIHVTTIGSESTTGLIRSAIGRSAKKEIQNFGDKIARIFVPCVLLVALLSWMVWTVIILTNRVPAMHTPNFWMALLRALRFPTALIASACPCAFGFAAPSAIAIAVMKAKAQGVVVCSLNAFETSTQVRKIILDKTGTLTQGFPSVTRIAVCPDSIHTIRLLRSHLELDVSVLMYYLSSVEIPSQHPYASVIRGLGKDTLSMDDKSKEPTQPKNFLWEPGVGISGEVDGFRVQVRNTVPTDVNIHVTEVLRPGETEVVPLSAWIDVQKSECTSQLYIYVDTLLIGMLSLRDRVKDDAFAFIQHLRENRIEPWVATGDIRSNCLAVSYELDVPLSRIRSQMTPIGKSNFVKDMELTEGHVAMIGDGINDAAALANASCGIAILPKASAILTVSSDVVILNTELSSITAFFEISRKTVATISRNYAWASLFNIVVLPFAAGLFYPYTLPAYLGGALMTTSSTIVLLNSLTLLIQSPRGRPNKAPPPYDPRGPKDPLPRASLGPLQEPLI